MSNAVLAKQHKIFADHFLVTGHITQSAKKAGYAENSAHVSGSRLLKRPDVQAYLEHRAAKLTKSTEDLQTRVLNEIEAMAFASIGDFIRIDDDGRPQVDFSGASEAQLRAIASVSSKRRVTRDKDGRVTEDEEAKFAMADKYRGLELLGKHLGMFKADEQRVVVDVADRLLAARQRYLAISDQGGGGAGV